MSTLDRSKPFGEVYGSGVSHRYEQGGRLFDHEGKLVGEPAASAPAGDDLDAMDQDTLYALSKTMGLDFHPNTGEKKLKEAIRKARAAAPAGDQLAQQLAG